jgi:hypothetical protein
VNVGELMCAAPRTLIPTVVFLAVARVVQTMIE